MRVILFFFLLAYSSVVFSQPLKMNFAAGFANYSGDIQQKPFTLNQAHGAFTVGGSYDLNEHFALRADLSFAKVGADDKFQTKEGTRIRNLNFKSKITELAVLAQYSPLSLEYNKWTPYVFAGVGVYKFNPYTYDNIGYKVFLQPLSTEGQGLKEYPDRKVYKTVQLNVPIGGGIIYAVSEDIHLGFEVGFRRLFTDYLDDVSTRYVNENILFTNRGAKAVELAFRGDELKVNPIAFQEGGQRGSPDYKDYYYFGQLKLGLRLNWFESYSSGTKRFGCPSRIF
jgi:hypothetical protein